MLSADQVARFERDGCLRAGRVLTDEQIEVLRDDLDKVIAGETEHPPVSLRNLGGDEAHPVWQIVNIWQASDAFRALACDPAVVTAVAQVSGADSLYLWHDQIQYKPARHGGVNHWHQDGPYWPTLGDNTAVSAWIPLDDVDESNGCMTMIPGSHRWGVQIDYLHRLGSYNGIGEGFSPPDGRPVAKQLWPVERGCLSLHHCLTWHGSHENTSERPRRAIAFHYMLGDTPFEAAGEHLMKPWITSAPGEPVRGEPFLCVWRDGAPCG